MAAEVPMQLDESVSASKGAAEVQSSTEAMPHPSTLLAPAEKTLDSQTVDAHSSVESIAQVEESMSEAAPTAPTQETLDTPALDAHSLAEVPRQPEDSVLATQSAEGPSSAEAAVPPTAPVAHTTESPGAADLVIPMAAFVKPDKPKKCVSAYWIYTCCVRDEVSRELREKGVQSRMGDIAKAIGQRWKDLPEAERKVYEDKAAADRQRFETEMQAYTEAHDPVAYLRSKYKHLVPQRPLSAQGLFSQDAKQREKAEQALQADGKEKGSREVSSKLAEMWKEVSAEERISYEAEHTKLQLEYLERLKPWHASPEFQEIERAEKAQQQVQKVVELAKEAAEARQKEADRAAKKRGRAVGPTVVETPPKRGRGAQQSTPPPAATKLGKGQAVAPIRIEDKVLKEASKLGLAVALENLAGRPEVISSRKSARAVLDALKASGGLVNPAKRALLGL